MKPKEAIEQLTQLSKPPEIIFHSDDIKAVQLGIKALKNEGELYEALKDSTNMLKVMLEAMPELKDTLGGETSGRVIITSEQALSKVTSPSRERGKGV